ncbi:MAG TPA: tetratricopeptide repeat protein [Vicinamibacterales bacterium]|nr:tetratricopeptide repeat protein [Vicinamibacterales bacterium]
MLLQRSGLTRGRRTLVRGADALSEGRYDDAVRLSAQAVTAFERVHGSHHLEMVRPLNQLALAQKHQGRLLEAGPLYQRALGILVDHGQGESLAAAEIFHNLGGLEHAAGNWLRGEPFARRGVRIRRRLLGGGHPDVAADLTALAALLDRQGKFTEAERLYRRALATLERAHGSGHHLVAVTLNNLAAVRQGSGAFAEAEAMFRRALDIETRELGADHPKVAFVANNLAVLLKETRRPREAAALFRRARTIFLRRLGANHPAVAICLENYAQVLRRLGRTASARAAARRAARILSSIDAVNDDGVAVTGTINPMCTPYRLFVRPSAIHRVGVITDDAIPRGRKVIEYTGERISRRESGRRWNPKRSYLFEIDDRVHLDGAIGGSGAEYINHSCDPNLKTRILREHILYFSRRPIARGEELTVDYRYDADTDIMPCRCGAPTCRGTMNLRPGMT